jgi:CubicO group peptidase (beta-lactamase class C family)
MAELIKIRIRFTVCISILAKTFKLMKRILVLFFLFVISTSSAQVDLRKLDEYYARALKEWNIPGMSIAIVKDGKIIFNKGYGTKEMGKNEIPDENTLYAIASNSKAFTASIVAQLVDEGKISWDDKVKTYVPYFELSDPWISKEVTIRDALSHRVGLNTYSGDIMWYRSKLSGEQIIKRLKYLTPSYSFRAGYGYSNVMYVTVGELINNVTGKSWSQNLHSRFLGPLGMTRTTTTIKDLKKMGNYATPHLLENDVHKAMEWEDWENVEAMGAIISSVKDMSQWMIFQLNHGVWKNDTLLSSKSQNVTWTPHNNFAVDHTSKSRLGHFSSYGLGWQISDYNGKFKLSHTGGYSGMLSTVVLLPDENFGVVILTNGMKSIYNALANYTVDQFIKAPSRDWSKERLELSRKSVEDDRRIDERIKARVPNTKPSLPLEKYTGEYFTPVYGKITVKNESGKMKIYFEHTPDLEATLDHWHFDTWKLNWDHPEVLPWFTLGTVKFNTNNNGVVTGISFDVPNDDFWFEELNAERK